MPTISVKSALLFKLLGISYTEEQFKNLCWEYGLELEVTNTKEMMKERGSSELSENASEEVIYKIEVPANRNDLLCVEGIAQALKVFLGDFKVPVFKAIEPVGGCKRLFIKPSVATVRPHLVAAILRGVTFSKDCFNSFIELQEKLQQNVGRNRTLVSIGCHDLDNIQGPFVYEALEPDSIKFQPLNQEKEYTATELMVLYAKDSHLRQYLPIIKNSQLYPVLKDSSGAVLTFPPIITGKHANITLETKNVLIECTGTDLTKARIVLDTLVCMLSRYCKPPFTVEMVKVVSSNGKKTKYPDLKNRQLEVSVKELNQRIDFNLTATAIKQLLKKMGLDASVGWNRKNIVVNIPPTRHDIIHACDVYEDVAIAYGYNKIKGKPLSTNTTGSQNPLNKLTELLRPELMGAGYTEATTFVLCSKEDIGEKLRKPFPSSAVTIANPKTKEFQVARTTLLPGLLKTLSANKHMQLPLGVFEISDVVLKDPSKDVKTRNERHLCVVYYDKEPGFAYLHGLLDHVMALNKVPHTPFGGNNGYYLEELDDPTFLCPGQTAKIICKGQPIGTLGNLHPEVITNFELNMLCSALEISVLPFL